MSKISKSLKERERELNPLKCKYLFKYLSNNKLLIIICSKKKFDLKA